MPTLDWIGKNAVVGHHKEVPYRLIKCDKELSAGEAGDGNLLVEGDNLHALKALLPYYGGKVKCIYIDPPYPASELYKGSHRFQKHYFPVIGDLKSDGEEYDCAVFLDTLPEIKFWVRNLPGPGRETTSFWLQTSTDKFYPDFVCQLVDGRILVVEYKNATDWSNDDNKEKRALGGLWAERSGGSCIFFMPKGHKEVALAQGMIGAK